VARRRGHCRLRDPFRPGRRWWESRSTRLLLTLLNNRHGADDGTAIFGTTCGGSTTPTPRNQSVPAEGAIGKRLGRQKRPNRTS
jgi:hypothetical protein